MAKQYFAEAKTISDKDNGALWTVPLCGPLLFVDPDTRDAWRCKHRGDLVRRGMDHGDVAAAAVQKPAHAIDAPRVLSSRAEKDRLDAR